uniref:Uncharacterized protein n=1 Tax=Daphnia galeata TaxID=27404 RepID=A0A8J2WNH4_9CRUS|nr:unnamed protein product [Daphnia galeata]
MKCLLFFTLVLVGVLTSFTEGCMSEAHNANHKSGDDSKEESDDGHHVSTTVKPATNAAHTFSIIPAKSVVVIASTEKPAAIQLVSETTQKTADPEMIHSTPLIATITTNNTDPIQSTEGTTTVKAVVSTSTASSISTQKPALVFAETPNKVAPIAITAQIITATPMVEEVSSMKPSAIHSLNATTEKSSSVNVTVEAVSKPVVVTTVVTMAPTTAAIAEEHSTEKPAVRVVPEMTKLTTATMNSTEKSAVTHIVPEMTNVTTASTAEHSTEKTAVTHIVPEMTNLTTVANAMNSTEKPAVHVVPEMANLTTAPTTVEHSTEKSAVIHIVPEMTNTTTASANALEHSTEHPAAVHVVKEMTNLTTAAMNSTEKPAHVTAEMMPSTTAVPAISSEKPTHVTEAINKTNEE